MTTELPDTHSSSPATGPLALKSNLVLGLNARKLASQLENAAYNCGYEDAHPSNATTRQAKADAKCREVLAALYAEIDRMHASAGESGGAAERKAARVRAIVDAGPFPGMSEAFDAHMGAACWTDPAYAPDAATWAAAWKAAKRGADPQPRWFDLKQ